MDFTITCRTCLMVNDAAVMLSVFDFENAEFATMIEACSETKVNRHDGLPAQICIKCSDDLREFHKFKQRCENSYKTLQQVFDHSQTPEEKRRLLWCPSPNRNPIDHVRRPNQPKYEVVYHKFKDRELSFEMTENEKCIQTDEITFFACEMCNMKFVSEDALKLHGPVHQESGFRCIVCSNMFDRLTHLRRHIAAAHPDVNAQSKRPYEIVCTVCDKKFARTDGLHRHMVKKHSGGKVELDYEDDFECDQCELVFRNAMELKAHGKCPGKKALEQNPRRVSRREVKVKVKPQTDDEEVVSDIDDANNDEDYVPEEDEKSELATKTHLTFQNDLQEPVTKNEAVDDELKDPKMEVEEEEPFGIEEHLDDDIIEYDPTGECIEDILEPVETETTPIKRGRGRPRKTDIKTSPEAQTPVVSHKRGRPRKTTPENTQNLVKKELIDSDTVKAKVSVAKEKVSFKCKQCPKTFTRLEHLRRHIIIHSNIKPFACEVCEKRFTRMDHLNIHRHHHSAVKPFNCDVCQRGFTRASHLQKHKESRHTEGRAVKTEICTVCNKGFSTPKYLQVHMKVHLDKEFVCKFCSERFATKEELLEHKEIHANEKPYLCSECGASFVRNDYLTIHMRRHKGYKPYKCKYCDKAFPRSTDLTVHERYHTGERTHICKTCGKGFQRAYNLLVHMRIHTGEKPYECPHCEKSFAQGNDLKAHIRRHTGERFKCEICGEGFIQGYHLTQHKRKTHGIDVPSHIQRVEKFTPVNKEVGDEVLVDEEDYGGMVNDIIHEVVAEDESNLMPVKREMEITVGDNQTAIIEFHL